MKPPSPLPLNADLSPAQLRLLRGVSRSFYLSIRLLPRALRAPIAVGYLLARATDTVADTSTVPQAQRQTLLSLLLQAIETPGAVPSPLQAQLQEFARHQTDPHERALMQALPACLPLLQSLPADDQASVRWVLRPITQGQTLDICRFGQAPSDPATVQALANEDELTDYTWQVAGCVGEFWTELCARHLRDFATRPTHEMRQLGRHYGMGLQRLNILRDAGADLAQGRCYLPAEQLARLGLTPASLARAAQTHDASTLEQLTPLWSEYMQNTQTQMTAGLHYSRALTSRRLRLASVLPALIGARTLALLAQAGPHALARTGQRIKMPRHEVRALLWRLLLRGVSADALTREFERLSSPVQR